MSGHAPLSGDGNGFATRYAEDFALLAGLGLTHHRLSLEWARLEPEPGVHDPAAIHHYRDVLRAAHDAGISPWVSLHHFTLPRWFLASGGFLVESNRTEVWRRHVDFVAETFGDLVGGLAAGERDELLRPGRLWRTGLAAGSQRPAEMAVVNEAIHLANAEAAVRLRQTGAPVSSIFGLSPIVPQDDDPATASMARALFDYYWAPWVGLFRDGVLQVPGRDAGRAAGPGRLRRHDRVLVLRHHGRP